MCPTETSVEARMKNNNLFIDAHCLRGASRAAGRLVR
jgi:hypothetical protein